MEDDQDHARQPIFHKEIKATMQNHIKENSSIQVYTDQSNQPVSIKYEIMCCCGSIPYNCVHASYLKESSMSRLTVIQNKKVMKEFHITFNLPQ